jgi:hypothetical protein
MKAAVAKSLYGKKVEYLLACDIDQSGRGYFFPRYGVVRGQFGRNIQIGESWLCFNELIELVEITAAHKIETRKGKA